LINTNNLNDKYIEEKYFDYKSTTLNKIHVENSHILFKKDELSHINKVSEKNYINTQKCEDFPISKEINKNLINNQSIILNKKNFKKNDLFNKDENSIEINHISLEKKYVNKFNNNIISDKNENLIKNNDVIENPTIIVHNIHNNIIKNINQNVSEKDISELLNNLNKSDKKNSNLDGIFNFEKNSTKNNFINKTSEIKSCNKEEKSLFQEKLENSLNSSNKILNNSINKTLLVNNSYLNRTIKNKSTQNESILSIVNLNKIDLNYSYFNKKIDVNSSSRLKFYNFFLKENGDIYKKYNSVKEFYKDFSKNNRNQYNQIYQKLLSRENYLDIDEELRLLYLNYIVLVIPFLSLNQVDILEKEIINIFLLNNKHLGNFSLESQKIFKEIFLNPVKKTNNNVNQPNLLHENIVNDYFEKKDNFNNTDIFSMFFNIRKIKNVKNLFKILIYDEILKYLKPDVKTKIKFFFYILIENYEKLSNNKDLLKCLYIFKFFYHDYEYENNKKEDIYQNYSHGNSNIIFNKTGNSEMDFIIKNLFKRKFYKNNKSLEINGLNFENIIMNIKISEVFEKNELIIFEETINKIKFFYNKKLERKKAKLSLIARSNLNFVFNLLDFVDFKITKNIDYRLIYIKLEKNILQVFENQMENKSLIFDNHRNSIPQINSYSNKRDYNNYISNDNALFYYPYSIYKHQKNAFDKISLFLEKFTNNQNKHMIINNNYETKIFPFGSITQFLGTPNADLDLYLDIKIKSLFHNAKYKNDEKNDINPNENNFNQNQIPEHIQNDLKASFIINLYHEIKKDFLKNQNKAKVDFVKSNRLLTFTFEFQVDSCIPIKIDINFSSCLGILNSSLLRTYSLLDQRFSILSIYLKFMVKEYGINNDEKKGKINNYSWTFILITFLQDVIQPPILPKILSYLKSKNNVLYLKEKKKKENYDNINNLKKDKFNCLNKNKKSHRLDIDIKDFFHQMKDEREYEIPHFLNLLDENNFEDQNFIEDFYKNNKNEMSLAEIYIAFLEFIIFYFKFENNIVYTSGNDKEEGFYGKNLLKTQKFTDILDKYKNSFFVIRDPIEISYNPTAGVEENAIREIKEAFKKSYNDILLVK